MRVATIMKNANDLLFPSPKYTRQIIRNGDYLQIVRGLEPSLNESLIEFDHAKCTYLCVCTILSRESTLTLFPVAKQSRFILNIEYEYAQLCMFSLALQATISRHSHGRTNGTTESVSQGPSAEEEKHLRRTVKASRTILRTVLDDLLPHGILKYIPVRSYSRLLGATLLLLKVSSQHFFSCLSLSCTKPCNQCCAASISEIDIPTSLDLVRQVAFGLRSSVVDDTHLSSRWGDLLESLANRLESRLAQPASPKDSRMTFLSEAPRATHEIQLSTIDQTSQNSQTHAKLANNVLGAASPSGGAKGDTEFDAWSMCCDDQFSQVNLNYMPWFPSLGLVGGSDLPTSSDAADNVF